MGIVFVDDGLPIGDRREANPGIDGQGRDGVGARVSRFLDHHVIIVAVKAEGLPRLAGSKGCAPASLPVECPDLVTEMSIAGPPYPWANID